MKKSLVKKVFRKNGIAESAANTLGLILVGSGLYWAFKAALTSLFASIPAPEAPLEGLGAAAGSDVYGAPGLGRGRVTVWNNTTMVQPYMILTQRNLTVASGSLVPNGTARHVLPTGRYVFLAGSRGYSLFFVASRSNQTLAVDR